MKILIVVVTPNCNMEIKNRMRKRTENSTLRVMIHSFVIIPLLVAILIIFIFSLINIVTTPKKDALDYLTWIIRHELHN